MCVLIMSCKEILTHEQGPECYRYGYITTGWQEKGEFVPGWRRHDCLFQGPATREIVQEHHDTAAYHTARAFTEQLSTAHFISAHPSDSQTGVTLIHPQKSPKPQGRIGAAYLQIGKLKQKRGCETPKKGSEAESGLEGSCLIAKLFKYHNS